MFIVEILAIVAGFGGMVVASQRAVGAASDLAVGAQISPFIIGFTMLAIGTDLPEIANSIVSSVTDHGDVNVGDSVGSAATQVTLVLGILGIGYGPLPLPNGNIARTGAFTVLSLAVLAVCISDGRFGRVNALFLLAIWGAGSAMIYRRSTKHHQLSLPQGALPKRPLVVKLVVAFLGLAGASMVSLWAVVAVAERFDAPEFLVGFFLASLGTSLPELVFDITAIRRGSVALAIGDIIGSSFIDTTLSVSIGPLIAPTDVSSDLLLRGVLISLVAIGFVTFVLSRVKEHDWRTGAILLFTYAAFFVTML